MTAVRIRKQRREPPGRQDSGAPTDRSPSDAPRLGPTLSKMMLLSILCTLFVIYVLSLRSYLDHYLLYPTPVAPTPIRDKTAMCTISIYDEAYLDEFVDYHRALGFDHFFIYDNSEGFELKQWGKLKGDHVEVIHFPGKAQQMEAYWDCWSQMKKSTAEVAYEWAAFFDTDEFLVLKKHDHVADMLKEYCPQGGLSVNWFVFATDNNWNIYSPQPVTKRFVFYKGGTDMHTKTMARVDSIKEVRRDKHSNPHSFLDFKNDGLTMKDTNGKRVDGPFNKEGPTDAVVLHHYHHKSAKEYVAKLGRGRAATGTAHKHFNQTIIKFENALATERVPNDYEPNDPGFTFDDSAWQFLKKKVPAYALFDEIAVSPFTKR